jgi:hypothetical protein
MTRISKAVNIIDINIIPLGSESLNSITTTMVITTQKTHIHIINIPPQDLKSL